MILEKILNKIAQNGFINIADFMNIALADANAGYYRKNLAIGRDGDFITAPEIHQIFGEIIAGFLAYKITEKYQGKKINLVEFGAGKGTLCADILRVFKKFPEIYEIIDVYIIDINKTLIDLQKQNLEDHSSKINWISSLKELPELPSIFYANEFFDALPVRQFKKINNNFLEVVVKADSKDKLYFAEQKILENEQILKLLESKNADINFYEHSQETEIIFEEICRFISKYNGLFITLDYGYDSPIQSSTLQSLYNHKFNNVFNKLGEADITCLVNFQNLIESAGKYNDLSVSYGTQKNFLETFGIKERVLVLSKNRDNKTKKELDLALNRLTSEDEMGNLFKCLVVEK